MPVIINDFDIMTDSTEPPPVRSTAAPDEPEPAPTSAPHLRPEEITQAVRVRRERIERVRAD